MCFKARVFSEDLFDNLRVQARPSVCHIPEPCMLLSHHMPDGSGIDIVGGYM